VRLLLDTYVVMWALRDPARLSPVAEELIRDPANELLISAVVPWEIATKHRIGRLPDTGSLLLAFEDHIRRLGAVELPVTARHAIAVGQLQWASEDPFDRMLAAQSIIEGIPIVTADPVFLTLPTVRVAWN
jgi:PIN domain nuclease of toxin-antitoxin system